MDQLSEIHKKDSTYWIKVYWVGAMTQMFVTCVVLFLFRKFNISYPAIFNFLFLAIGGTSSALWGSVVAKKSNKIKKYKEIIFDFFRIKQPISYYIMVSFFIMILFGASLFTGNVLEGVMWYTFPSCFVIALLFGGIEEIGWRYTFQPMLEKRIPYEIASVLTFLSWGLWHYMYFYITDSIAGMQHVSFLFGLLVSCFVLGAIYRITHSLWLCVLYHCLINTFSQTLVSGGYVSGLLCIVVAVMIVRWNEHTWRKRRYV